jgi:RNA polymerase sigma factor (TIGR02999 family)
MREAEENPLIHVVGWSGHGIRYGGPPGHTMGVQESRNDLTALLGRWRTGTPEDRERLFEAVHGELRRTAGAYMKRERSDHTLQPTALVHEAYLRLIRDEDVQWEDRAHFFGIAARVMRQVLVDHARKRAAGKRKVARVDLSASQIADPSVGVNLDVLDLHEALDDMAALDPRQAEIVELRYFGGLTENEVATLKKLSPVTIRREIAAARFWLGRRMKGQR